MRLKYAHLCDHVAIIVGGKPAIVGIFDGFYNLNPARKSWEPVALPFGFLISCFGLNAGDVVPFSVSWRLVDADGNEVGSWNNPSVDASIEEPGVERKSFVPLQIVGAHVPGFGDYVWEIYANNERVGEVTMYVRAQKQPAEA